MPEVGAAAAGFGNAGFGNVGDVGAGNVGAGNGPWPLVGYPGYFVTVSPEGMRVISPAGLVLVEANNGLPAAGPPQVPELGGGNGHLG